MEELPAFEQPRRAGMIERGTRPEDAHLLVDLLVGDAVVIGDAAARGLAQFLEDLARFVEREVLAAAQAARQIADDLRIGARIAGRIHGLLNMDHAPLHVAGDALLFFLQAAGQHDVGMRRGFRKEEIDDAEELQLLQRFAREIGVGQRDQRVEADREQPLDLAARESRS